ncbi:MFS transporter [Acidisoma cellulosilytica]|uniref:MFS transporter n=2 Tax=Acidisoma cellulosilyticum TaxID=2802395 RepID=A0A964E244_9PROT|nr:MFS transporter [Acidisoma cellulosilyticum]
MTGFLCIATETIPAGLLPGIAHGLAVSPSLAGQLVTAYALGSVVAAIPLNTLTGAWPRRRVLLLTIAGFLVFNGVTAISADYRVTLAARFLAGASAGLAWSILAAYARRMVARPLQGRAMAVAMVGTPIALSIGVPLGTWLGAAVGWRATFAIMSGLALLLAGWVLIVMPNYPGQQPSDRLAIRHVLATPGVIPVLGVVMAWMTGHNLLYTYIAPFLAPVGLAPRVDLMLMVFGVAALLGIWVTGRLVDRALRAAVLASLGGFAAVALAFGMLPFSPALVIVGVAIWGLSFGGAATLLQTALADAAGPGAEVALSINVVVWNTAIAAGGLLGGVLLPLWGIAAFAWVLLIFLLVALAVAWGARSHGFPPGQRRHS